MEELAWAVGLFDGAGTITLIGGRTRRLAVKMSDEGCVRRFGESIRIGKVYGPHGPYASSLGSVPTFIWIAENDAALEAALLLRPWLGSRCRDRLDELFGADTFAGFR